MTNPRLNFHERLTKVPFGEARASLSHGVPMKLRFILTPLALMLCLLSAVAGNLIVNPGFEANSGNVVAAGWTYFRPPNGGDGSYWVDSAGNRAHTGSFYWKQWGIYWDAARTNVAGIYQQFNSAPGSVYEADGWFYTVTGDSMGPNNKAWLEVSFRDSGGQVLALYKSEDFSAEWGLSTWFNLAVTNICDLSQPIPSGDTNSAYFYYAVTGSVSQLVAPVGTAFVRYQFAMVQGGGWPEGGGAVQFDDATLDQISGPIPPAISALFPANPSMFVNPDDGLSFIVNSPSGTTIESSGIKVNLNGEDISAGLTINGTAANKTVSYSGLASNTVYTATITVTDVFNFSATASTYFETTWVGIPAPVFLWEAEDFDFGGGQYIQNPVPCTLAENPNCYYGKEGVEGTDYQDIVGDGDHLYRGLLDRMATTGAGDILRKKFVDAGALDYKVGWYAGGEWVNYTRNWPSGTYWVIGRLANGGGSGTLTLSKVVGGVPMELGTFTIESGTGWTSYDYYYLKDANGNIANVTLNGVETLRATTGGNVDTGFFVLVPAQLDVPVLSDLYPDGAHPFQYTNRLSFSVTSVGGAISSANIKLILNDIDVSSALEISGTPSARSVLYPSLLPNAIHTAVLTVTNDTGAGIRVAKSFDTFSQENYMVEAEDYDYDGGKYFDDPLVNSYASLGGTEGIDCHNNVADGEQFAYRLGLPTEIAADYVRERFTTGGTDYNMGWFGAGDWGNYTRVYPSGTFLVYGRFAADGGYTAYLERVTSGHGTTTQTTQRFGRWSASGNGWQSYKWVLLTDEAQLTPAIIRLSGVETLRIVSSVGSNPNFIMLVPTTGIQISATRSGNDAVISFPTQAGVNHRVFWRAGLTEGDWTLLGTVAGDGTVKSITDAANAAQRYYKVTVP